MVSEHTRGTIDFDYSGRLVNDLFFRIWPGPFSEDQAQLPGILLRQVSDGYPTEIEVEDQFTTESCSRRCVQHTDFRDFGRIETVACRVKNMGTHDGDVFGHELHEFIHMSKRLQDALLDANFNGTRFATTEIRLDCVGTDSIKEVRTLCFDGRDIRRSLVVHPDEENQCYYCNYLPIVCPNCPTFERACPNCGKDTWRGRTVSLSRQPNETLLKIMAIPDEEYGPVLDYRLWDGSDFIGTWWTTNSVTGRVVDLLLTLDIRNIAIQPQFCFVPDSTVDYGSCRSRLFPRHLIPEKAPVIL